MAKPPKLGLRPGNERDILAARWEIEHEEVFHLKNLYKVMFEWLLEEGYSDMFIKGNNNFENLYYERILQGGDKEHHIWWRCQLVPSDNGYYRYVLKIDFQTLTMGTKEIMHQGMKFKTYEGDLILRCEAWIQLDYKNEWENHWLLKYFDEAYRKRLYKKNVEIYKQDLYNTAYRLQTFVKEFLMLKSPIEMPHPFHPQKGI
ncbi:MAG: hypothetical protein V1743_01260 [Nanoarchaeota archaeon]